MFPRITFAIIVLFYSPAFATTITAFPWTMDSEPDTDTRQDGVAGAGGCTATWYATGGWANGPYFRFIPPTQCSNGNGQYCGLGLLDFPDTNDIYVGFLIRWSANWEESAVDCGYNSQVKMIITGPDPRGMLISQSYCDGSNYTIAPCANTVCDWVCSGSVFRSGDYSEEWVWVEVHFNGSEDQVDLYIETQDGVFTATQSTPYASYGSGIIGNPIQFLEGLGYYFNGYFTSGAWYELSAVTIDSSYIGPPVGFGDSQPSNVPNIAGNGAISIGGQ